jgi:predicted ArsR family transcriptional regulator
MEEVVYITPRSKEGEMRRSTVEIRYRDIESLLNMNLTCDQAAKSLGISRTAFRNAFTKLGLAEWPYKRRKKVISTEEDDKNNPYNLDKNYIDSYIDLNI